MIMRTFSIFSVAWNEIASVARTIVPPLLHSEHKGTMGRIGFIGGSRDYTGAIYYASESSLRFGGDLSFVFCSEQASIPIKSYSPELMVTPFYDDETIYSENEISHAATAVKAFLPRVHTLVVGPGLGRDESVMKAVEDIISSAKAKNMQLVVDADGLWLLTNNIGILHGYHKCIITPNQMEFSRLVDATKAYLENQITILENSTEEKVSSIQSLLAELASEDEMVKIRALSLGLGGLTILRKGESDVVTSGGDVFVLNEKGSPRRCGGQGDLLAGCLSVAYYWSEKMKLETANKTSLGDHLRAMSAGTTSNTAIDLDLVHQVFPGIQASKRLFLAKKFVPHQAQQLAPDVVTVPTNAALTRQGGELAALLASAVVKKAAELAFAQTKRSTTTPFILEKIGEAFELIAEHPGPSSEQ